MDFVQRRLFKTFDFIDVIAHGGGLASWAA
jgi:hypothetical protein